MNKHDPLTLHQSHRLNFKYEKSTIGFHSTISLFFIFALLSTIQLSPIHAVISQCSDQTKHDTDNFTHLLLNNILFVDKSLLVEEFLQYDGTYKAQTVVRPKGWGKSTNLNMLEKFFEIEVDEKGDPLPKEKTINDKLFLGGTVQITETESKELKPLKIATLNNATEHLGKHPVIFLRLEKATGENYEELETRLKSCVVDVFRRHKYLSYSAKISQKEQFEKYLGGDFNSTELLVSLNFLALKLQEHFGQDVIILVDDYDIPLISAYREFKTGTGEDSVKVERLLEHLLDGARKRTIYHIPKTPESTTEAQNCTGIINVDSASNTSSNSNTSTIPEDHTSNTSTTLDSNHGSSSESFETLVVEKRNLAMLAGVLDLSFESFRVKGVLHFDKVYTLFDKPFSKFFGLTNEEIENVLARAPTAVDPHELRLWYDGYPEEMKLKSSVQLETSQIKLSSHFYTTRSVMRCLLGNSGTLDYYGDPIQSHGLIEDILSLDKTQELVQQSLCGGTHWMGSYPYYGSKVRWSRTKIHDVLSDYFTILIFNGFLSSCESDGRTFSPRLGLSNKEMRHIFKIKQMQWVFDKFQTNREEFHTFAGSLYTGLIEEFGKSLQKYLSRASEFIQGGQDKAKISYKGLMTAVRTNLENVIPASESTKWDGTGNDIFFVPRLSHGKIAIIVRYAIVDDVANLTHVAKTELEQIKNMYFWSNSSVIQKTYPYVRKIIILGIAFCAEKVKIEFESNVTSCEVL